MAGNTYLWSTTAATNSNADNDINWVEGQLPSTVNDSARGMMAGVAGWLKDTNSTLTTGGSANAHTVTSNVAYVALATGLRLHLKAGFTNTAAATLNLTPAGGAAFGAKAIKVYNTAEADPQPGNITVGMHYIFEYDSAANAAAGAWMLLNPTHGQWTTWTPTITSAFGTITSSTVNSARYTRIGNMVTCNFNVTITDQGSGTGDLLITLPINPIATFRGSVFGREVLAVGIGIGGQINATQISCARSDNLALIITGYQIVGSAVYEV